MVCGPTWTHKHLQSFSFSLGYTSNMHKQVQIQPGELLYSINATYIQAHYIYRYHFCESETSYNQGCTVAKALRCTITIFMTAVSAVDKVNIIFLLSLGHSIPKWVLSDGTIHGDIWRTGVGQKGLGFNLCVAPPHDCIVPDFGVRRSRRYSGVYRRRRRRLEVREDGCTIDIWTGLFV